MAYGQPVVGKTVVALDSAGKTCATATTAGDGSYSMDTSGCAPGSAALSIQGYTTPSGVPLLSVAVPPQGKSIIDGVVNIDPLTTLLAYDVVGILSSSTLPASSAQVLALLPQVTAAQVQQATTNILTVSLLTDLQTNYGVTTTGLSLTSTPFTANGQGLDAFFDAYTLSAPSAGSVQIASTASGLTVSVSLPPAAGSPSTVTSSVSYTVGGNVSGIVGRLSDPAAEWRESVGDHRRWRIHLSGARQCNVCRDRRFATHWADLHGLEWFRRGHQRQCLQHQRGMFG